MNKLTNVESKDDFARLLGFSNSRFMNYVLYVLRTEELYETFTIPKKSGGERTIKVDEVSKTEAQAFNVFNQLVSRFEFRV